MNRLFERGAPQGGFAAKTATVEPDAASNARPTLALVSRHRALRSGLPVLLSGVDLVGVYSTVEELLDHSPIAEVVLLDPLMPAPSVSSGLRGCDAVEALAGHGYFVCLYSDETRIYVLARFLQAGALGLARTSDSVSTIEAIIARSALGRLAIPPQLEAMVEYLREHSSLPILTPRQRDVLRARARGERWSNIAKRLFITEGVAREHMSAVQAKFARLLPDAAPADLERALGCAVGDLLDD